MAGVRESRLKNVVWHSLDIALMPEDLAPTPDMPEARARRMSALVKWEDKARCLGAWLLMREFLGKKTRAIRLGKYGKPYIPGGPYFSVAHSGSHVVLALAKSPIGVDIEMTRHEEDCALLASCALHPLEKAIYDKTPVPQTFYDIWTLKESYLKMLGMGLNEDPKSFAILMDGPIIHAPGKPEISFALRHDLPGHVLAIAVMDANTMPTK